MLAVDRDEDPKAHLLGMSGGAVNMRDYLVEQVLSHQALEVLAEAVGLARPLGAALCRRGHAGGGIAKATAREPRVGCLWSPNPGAL